MSYVNPAMGEELFSVSIDPVEVRMLREKLDNCGGAS